MRGRCLGASAYCDRVHALVCEPSEVVAVKGDEGGWAGRGRLCVCDLDGDLPAFEDVVTPRHGWVVVVIVVGGHGVGPGLEEQSRVASGSVSFHRMYRTSRDASFPICPTGSTSDLPTERTSRSKKQWPCAFNEMYPSHVWMSSKGTSVF